MQVRVLGLSVVIRRGTRECGDDMGRPQAPLRVRRADPMQRRERHDAPPVEVRLPTSSAKVAAIRRESRSVGTWRRFVEADSMRGGTTRCFDACFEGKHANGPRDCA